MSSLVVCVMRRGNENKIKQESFLDGEFLD